MDKDELKGKAKQGMGGVKEKAGHVTGNEKMQSRGKADQMEGKAQEGYGKAKGKAHEMKDKVTG